MIGTAMRAAACQRVFVIFGDTKNARCPAAPGLCSRREGVKADSTGRRSFNGPFCYHLKKTQKNRGETPFFTSDFSNPTSDFAIPTSEFPNPTSVFVNPTSDF